jgi:hypothetical protein
VIVLGIDSATTAGWAVVDGERLIEYGTVDARDPIRVWQLAGHLVVAHAPALAVIEDSYLGRGAHANVATAKLLSRLIGRWEMALAARGVRAELVLPQAWQTATLAGFLPPGRVKRDDRKRAAAAWAKATYGVTITGDAADAVGLATYASRRASMDAKLRRAAG